MIQLTENTRSDVTVFFADIVGYTTLMHESEATALNHIQKFKSELEEKIPNHKGQIIQYFGDGCLAVFEQEKEAVQCAMALQNCFKKGLKVKVRIGLNSGRIFFKEGNIFGDAVNVASRIESLGTAGAVLLSQNVIQKLKQDSGFNFTSLGFFEFKNVAERKEVFAISNPGFPVPDRDELTGKLEKSKSNSKSRLTLAVGVLSFLTILAFYVFYPKPYDVLQKTHEKKLAVMIFENQTGDTNYDVVGKMVSDWVSQGLMQIDDVTLVTPSTVREKVTKAGLNGAMQELKMKNGVNYILNGNYYIEDDQIIIKSYLLNTQSNEVEYFLPDYKSIKSKPLEAVRELTERTMGYWLNASEIKKRKTVPPKYEAYRTFLKGMEYYEVDKQILRNHLLEALEIDSTYFDPKLYLSFSYYYNEPRKTKEADSILTSIKKQNIKLTNFQESKYKAALSEFESNSDKSYLIYKSLFEKYPDDSNVRFNAGAFALFSNHLNEAIEILNGFDFENLDYSINIEKRNILFLFDALNQKGEYKRILELSEKHLKDYPDYFYTINSHLHLGHLKTVDSLQSILDNVANKDLRRPKSYYYNILGRENLKLGNKIRAKNCFIKSIQFSLDEDDTVHYDRVYALFYLGEYEKGIKEILKSIESLSDEKDGVHKGILHNFLVYNYAALEDQENVKKYREMRKKYPFQHYYSTTDAYVEMKFGRKKEAVDFLKKAYADGVVFEDISFFHNVDFLPMRGFPLFDEFVKPKN